MHPLSKDTIATRSVMDSRSRIILDEESCRIGTLIFVYAWGVCITRAICDRQSRMRPRLWPSGPILPSHSIARRRVPILGHRKALYSQAIQRQQELAYSLMLQPIELDYS